MSGELSDEKAQHEPIRTAGGIDITEGVQILYDIAHSSMDWGSGFLDNDEMEKVIRFAITLGWQVPDLPDNSDAMLSVARKFPEHYRIETTEIPASTTSGGYHFQAYTRVRVVVIRPGEAVTQ